MDFDLRTCNSAFDFILDLLQMKSNEYVEELIMNSGNDFEVFWERNIDRIAKVNVHDIKVMAFHVLGSLDQCEEIKKNGLKNLQMVLSENTIFSRLLKKAGIAFDIHEKTVSYNGNLYDIDYEHYSEQHFLTETEEKLDRIAHRVFYDFCVNGFMMNDDIRAYGTRIHERPEFLMTLAKLFPAAKKVEQFWETKAESYKIDFYATVDQIHRFNFDLDEWRDPPYEGWDELDDSMKIKKWMLSHAIDRFNDMLGSEIAIYIKDDVIIPPDQLLAYSKL